jgi:hypothetical protein
MAHQINDNRTLLMQNYQASVELPATFLACPKKGGAKERHPATILIRPARSSSLHFRNSGFALRQSEMFNPRTRSHDGNVRMGRRSTALPAFPQIPHVPGAALRNFGAPVLAKGSVPKGGRELLVPGGQECSARSAGR